MKRTINILFSVIIFFCMGVANAKPNWSIWVAELKQQAVTQGVSPQLFDAIFKTIPGPDPRILRFDRTQPEHRITFYKYRDTRGGSFKTMLGRKEYLKHNSVLHAVGDKYGVDPCFIVALWGMETSYGHYTGNFPVVRSLATLAYDSRRSDHFRDELLLALQILNQHQVTLAEFKGEWAGASGQPQFLPSSWFKYAVDYDGDGRKNIWTSDPDVFASIANYLAKNGWQANQPWAIEAKLPPNFDESLLGVAVEKPVHAWSAMGVRAVSGIPLSDQNVLASLVKPKDGPVFLAYPNFKVLLKYNNSIYYAGTVGYMADTICRRQG